jgi:hypothetical protein
MGIEPTLVAWEATVLPLNYTRLGWSLDFRREEILAELSTKRLEASLSF